MPTVAPSTSVLPDTSSTKDSARGAFQSRYHDNCEQPEQFGSTATAPVQTPPSTTSAPLLILATAAPVVVAITSSGGPTYEANQTITGTVDVADAGATVTVLDGTTVLGSGVVQPSGSFTSRSR